MRILINCFSSLSGGTQAIGKALLSHLPDTHEYLAICPRDTSYEELTANDRLQFHFHPKGCAYPLGHLYYYGLRIAQIAAQFEADAFISITSNGAPLLRIPQFLIIHQAYLAVEVSYYKRFTSMKFRQRIGLQRMLFRLSLKVARGLMVQSHFMESNIRRTYNFRRPIVVLPPFCEPGYMGGGAGGHVDERLMSLAGTFRFLYAAHYYPQKNFEVLLRAMVILKRKGKPVSLVLTIDDRGFGAEEYLRKVELLNIEERVLNIGPVPGSEMPSLYLGCDGCVQVSLLEAYGITYIEAMALGRPQIVCDLGFVHEICGDAALYVPADSAEEVAEAMCRVAEDPALRADLVERGRRRIRENCVSPEEHTRTIIDAVVKMSQGMGGCGWNP